MIAEGKKGLVRGFLVTIWTVQLMQWLEPLLQNTQQDKARPLVLQH